MKNTSCRHCGESLASDFIVCPNCGAIQEKGRRTDHGQRNWLVLALLGFALLGAVLGYLVGEQVLLMALGAIGGLLVGGMVAGFLAYRRAM
jgi:hypothetical protein